MKQRIVGFDQDDERDWRAILACGHRQHVRHQPPLVSRPWVLTEQGRLSRIGYELDCLHCDQCCHPERSEGPGGSGESLL